MLLCLGKRYKTTEKEEGKKREIRVESPRRSVLFLCRSHLGIEASVTLTTFPNYHRLLKTVTDLVIRYLGDDPLKRNEPNDRR